MPQYFTKKQNTYYFRQGVPQELRAIIGRREIKRSLGRDFNKAASACKRIAVEVDSMIADARAKLDGTPSDPYSRENIRRMKHVLLTKLTPELEVEFGNLMRESLLHTDQAKRVARMNEDEFREYGEEINQTLATLRSQLPRGEVEYMTETARIFLVGRGYEPNFTQDEWRRMAYVLAEANLEAYERMALRQSGSVVKPLTDTVLASQFEVQNEARARAAKEAASVTWHQLYEVWRKECVRSERTEEAYLAAMELFIDFHKSNTPLTVTREVALEYRDYLLNERGKRPAAGTVKNKIGFLGTIINSGRNNAKFAKQLPSNPFENIKVKESKSGEIDDRRMPFSDSELSVIFSSPVYTDGFRPKGGAGEAAAWIPAISYLSGANLDEIALLTVGQFHTDACGNHYFRVGKGKNKNRANRDVPIHPALIQAGLLDYVKSCNGRLFPEVKSARKVQSAPYSAWFGRYLDDLKITSRSKVFHSFRHLFKDLCRNAGLDDSAIDQICGHEPGTVGGKYGTGRRIDVLSSMLATVVPPVAVPRITKPKDAAGTRHLLKSG